MNDVSQEAGRALDALVAERVMGISLGATTDADRGRAVMSAMSDSWPGHAKGWLGLRLGDKQYRVNAGREFYEKYDNDGYGLWCWKNRHGEEWEVPLEKHVRAWRRTVQPYSTEIAAAWTVVEKMVSVGWYAQLDMNKPGDFHAQFGKDRVKHGWFAKTAPRAICRAALAAVEAALQKGGGET